MEWDGRLLGARVKRRVRFDIFDLAAFGLFVVLILAAALTVRDYGISNDEEVQHRYGELIIAYYQSGFTDLGLFGYKNLYLYGGLFDIIAVLAAKILPADVFLIRHALCAAAGIGGIVATYATGRLIAGPRAGFLAALALATTAPWYGAMFNHTKDIPFAAAMMAATYFLLRIARGMPRPRWRDTLAFGVLFGAACGLRAIGLLLIGYLGIVVIAWLAAAVRRQTPAAVRDGMYAALRLLPGVAIGYAIMLAAWPWASLHILNPIEAIFAFAHFHYQIRTIFAGAIYEMGEVPRWYVSGYLVIRLPLLVMAGAIAAAVFAAWPTPRNPPSPLPSPSPTRAPRGDIALLWFMVIFPVAGQAIGHGPAFTGMRHFFFVVPVITVLAGVGIDASLEWLFYRERWFAVAMATAVAAIFAWEGSLLVRLHPHQYLYYNPLIGGLPGAPGRYNLDYWVNIMPEAVGRLKTYLDGLKDEPPGRRYTVGVCGERFSFEHEADARMEWTGGWYEADFFIAPTHMNCDGVTNGRVIVRIERLGVLIGVVKDRRGFPSPAAGLPQ
jgi:hypothetical protein